MYRLRARSVIGGRIASGLAVALGLALLALVAVGAGPPPKGRKAPSDDRTFRPTVMVRCGTAQGSGTVIASLDGVTLVLTAAHVIGDGKTAPEVELHRYNLGMERMSRIAGGWPRKLPADLVAIDRSADLAILRIGHMKRLPYVARIAPGSEEPPRGTVVTSVGIDLGEHLSSWMAYVAGSEWFALDAKKKERPFLVTTKPPEHGRSGGGLFLASGELVGVCIGRIEETKGGRVGIFASGASIRRLLRDHDLEETIARSDALVRQADARRRARLVPSSSTAPSPAPSPSPAGARPVTPTRAVPARRNGGT